MEIELVIASDDREFLGEIFNEPTIADARPIALGEGVAIRGQRWGFQKSAGSLDTVTILLSAAISVPASVIANVVTAWLMRNRKSIQRLTLSRREVQLDDEGRVRGVILEIISTEVDED